MTRRARYPGEGGGWWEWLCAGGPRPVHLPSQPRPTPARPLRPHGDRHPGQQWRAARLADGATEPAYGVGLVSRHPVARWRRIAQGGSRCCCPRSSTANGSPSCARGDAGRFMVTRSATREAQDLRHNPPRCVSTRWRSVGLLHIRTRRDSDSPEHFRGVNWAAARHSDLDGTTAHSGNDVRGALASPPPCAYQRCPDDRSSMSAGPIAARYWRHPCAPRTARQRSRSALSRRPTRRIRRGSAGSPAAPPTRHLHCEWIGQRPHRARPSGGTTTSLARGRLVREPNTTPAAAQRAAHAPRKRADDESDYLSSA